jgi:hypothetical protein
LAFEKKLPQQAVARLTTRELRNWRHGYPKEVSDGTTTEEGHDKN